MVVVVVENGDAKVVVLVVDKNDVVVGGGDGGGVFNVSEIVLDSVEIVDVSCVDERLVEYDDDRELYNSSKMLGFSVFEILSESTRVLVVVFVVGNTSVSSVGLKKVVVVVVVEVDGVVDVEVRCRIVFVDVIVNVDVSDVVVVSAAVVVVPIDVVMVAAVAVNVASVVVIDTILSSLNSCELVIGFVNEASLSSVQR